MTIDEIKFRIWQINCSIPYYENIIDRTTDETTIQRARHTIETMRQDKVNLYKMWEDMQ